MDTCVHYKGREVLARSDQYWSPPARPLAQRSGNVRGAQPAGLVPSRLPPQSNRTQDARTQVFNKPLNSLRSRLRKLNFFTHILEYSKVQYTPFAVCYNPEGRVFNSPLGHWIFNFPNPSSCTWPWGRLSL
jgi:hypothetical protein